MKLRTRGDATVRFRWMHGRDKQISAADDEGWVSVDIDLEDETNALIAVGILGADVEVISPVAQRRAAAQVARRFATMNS